MEWKIGEIFEFNGEWYQCVEQPEKYDRTVCALCAFQGNGNCELDMCSETYRSDKKSVIFKKLEKAGEPYTDYCPSGRVIYFQRYKCYQKPIYNGDFICWSDDISISIEIKNKEDMEENNNAKHSNSENIGKNLKPFYLEAAKAGKPVCTRDGRKARIICFDYKSYRCQPIIALVTNFDGREGIETYSLNGRFNDDINDISDYDLMVLPEKKEGWIVVRRSDIYENEEQAKEALLNSHTAMMIRKITWEE